MMRKMVRFLLLLICVSLCACARKTVVTNLDMDIGGQDVMIRVVNSAKSMRIIIPADSLFKVGAAKTSQYFLRVMQRPLALILYHPELNIKVEAYTDNVL